ncbi:reverse transcriptase domain-containing protein [Tanacetum coccineum]
MIKFPTANGIATMITKREILHECRRMEEAQRPAMEGRITLPQIQAPSFVGTTNQGKKEEHELRTYPHIEPRVQRKRSIAPDRRKVVKDEVAEWLKDGIVRKHVQRTYILCRDLLEDIILNGVQVQMFPKRLQGVPPNTNDQKDEEKMAFYTDEGVFFYTKMPFGLKNTEATYQRLVDTVFKGQMGRNLEAYVDDMVIKSKTEPEMIKDVEKTLLALKKVNMKLNPQKCSFGIEDGKFLGYIVTFEGIRANSEKAKAVVNMPSPSNLKQMQWLSGKLAALNKFLSKATKKALPCLKNLKKCTSKRTFIGQQRPKKHSRK